MWNITVKGICSNVIVILSQNANLPTCQSAGLKPMSNHDHFSPTRWPSTQRDCSRHSTTAGRQRDWRDLQKDNEVNNNKAQQ